MWSKFFKKTKKNLGVLAKKRNFVPTYFPKEILNLGFVHNSLCSFF